MAPEKDYTHRSWIAVTLLIAVLIGLSLIPPQTLGGVSLRRANILSSLSKKTSKKPKKRSIWTMRISTST